jgi:hypothetical protein
MRLRVASTLDPHPASRWFFFFPCYSQVSLNVSHEVLQHSSPRLQATPVALQVALPPAAGPPPVAEPPPLPAPGDPHRFQEGLTQMLPLLAPPFEIREQMIAPLVSQAWPTVFPSWPHSIAQEHEVVVPD